MELSFRTVVRAFLLVGGSAYLVYGLVDGTTFDVALGAFAAVVGAIGLWSMRLQASDGETDRTNGHRENDGRTNGHRENDDRAANDPGSRELTGDDLETHGLEDNE